MKLNDYLNLYEVLQTDCSTRDERRAFGLAHEALKEKPLEQLRIWTEQCKTKLKKPLLSETFSSYLYAVTLTLGIIAFVTGLFSGIALLRYNGHEPVNVIYFMAMVILVPMLTMTLTLFSMMRANRAQSMLVHLSPSYWMEKILSLFPGRRGEKLREDISELKISPLVSNWIVIKRSQMIALAFSFGLLLALLAMVSTRDIAFAWSTTLHISAESFHHFLANVAFPWRDAFPWAVPSVELVEQSQYYRLGGELSAKMIDHASLLGEWWKFLLFATLFYALFLRFLMFILSSIGLRRALDRSLLSLDGVNGLLNDFNEPLISTSAKKLEASFNANVTEYPYMVNRFEDAYDVVLGWAMDREKLKVINDSMIVRAAECFEAGGANSLEEDSDVIEKCHGSVLFYVKAWEPPTMDFIDFMEQLLPRVEKITVAPLGTVEQNYISKPAYINVWARKLTMLESEKVWLKV